jgi:WD40 repeat protein
MDGGSLKGFIDSEALYKGDEGTALERILDISIQFARGLHYAHEQKLIHQDVKPENLLLSKTGEAKVADFGIANAKTILGAEAGNASSGTGTIVSKSGGYTPAYCSPEQAGERELTRRTDVWSWAVSVLEMFTGERPWNNGVLAGMACENYFDMTRIPIPEAMKKLLRHCFKEDEAERPHDFKEIETVLLHIYRDSTGKVYARLEPKAAADTADSLNNKALSYLDLGKPEEAEKCWEQALTIYPSHAESLYNQGVHLWRNAKIDDIDALHALSVNPLEITDCYLAKIHLLRRDAESALTCLNKAKKTFGETDDIRKMVAAAHEMIEKGKDGKRIRTFNGHDKLIYSVCFSPDGKTALSGSKALDQWFIPIPDKSNYEMIISEVVSTGKTLHHAEQFDSLAAEARSFIQKGNIADALNTIREMSQISLFGKSIDYFTLKKSAMRYCVCNKIINKKNLIIPQSVNSVCFSPNGKTALSGNEDETIKLWEVETGICIRTFERDKYVIESVCFSPDGKMALSGGYTYIKKLSYIIKLWEVATGKCIRTFEGHNNHIQSVCFSPDGKTALSGSDDKTIKLWEVKTGICIRTFEGHSDWIYSVCFSPDGKTALSGGWDKTIKLWEVMTGQCIRTFEGHNDQIRSVCFSPDGKTALSGGLGGWDTIKLWDVATGQCIRAFNFTDAIPSVCFSPDGKTALSGKSNDNIIQLWDVATGQYIQRFEGHMDNVLSVCFSPDGANIISGSHNEIIIHDLDYDLSFPGWADWDEGARPYLEIFQTLHPHWTDEDFNNILIPDLQRRGYGWLRPEGVKAKLQQGNTTQETISDTSTDKTSFWKRLTGGK